MHAQLVAPMVDVDPAVLAERNRLGLDRSDEVWDGVLHMNPPASPMHGILQLRLGSALLQPADAAGLVSCAEPGLLGQSALGWEDFRVPDLMLFRPELMTERGVEGAPSLVIEIRSPGDDSYRKLPFFERVGAAEVLIIHRDTRAVRRWLHDGERLVECAPGPDGVHVLATIPVELATSQGQLIVHCQDSTTTI